MKNEQRERLEASNTKFIRAWQAFGDAIGGGELHSVEKHAHPVLKLLDSQAGIDWLQFLPDGSVRTIASRVNDYPWQTFTLRKHTEWPKYQTAITNHTLLPNYIINVYYDLGHLHSVGIIETDYLIKIINLHIAHHRVKEITKRYEDVGGTGLRRAMWSIPFERCPKAKILLYSNKQSC